jgi:hypothetical protein
VSGRKRPMDENRNAVAIELVYRDYRPPVDVERVIRRMIELTSPEYLAGLRSIVIRNSGSLNYQRRRSKTRSRRRKVAVRECGGLYHQKWKGEPAWIEIFVDNILEGWPKALLWIPLVRDLAIAYVLFHEIGHHVHCTRAPEHREKEDVANKWRNRLMGAYIKKRYWYLHPFLRVASWLIRLVVPRRIWRLTAT